MPRRRASAILALLIAAASAPEGVAQDQAPPAPDTSALGAIQLNLPPPRFGEADSVWVSGGVGVADNLIDAVDAYAWTALSWFAAEDVELGLELGLWGHNQPGDNAASLSVSNTIRWHFLNRAGWTLYGDVGFGMMASTSTVPDGGTGINFLPRVGFGFTRQLTESARLQMGLRWHHISNARIGGDLRNPSRDAPMFYAALIYAF